MKTISDTLEAVIERWDDPGGPYPCGAGSAPLPSYDYVAEIEGEVVVEIEASDFLTGDTVIEYDLPHGIQVKAWKIEKVEGAQFTLSVADFSFDHVEKPEREWEPDYE